MRYLKGTIDLGLYYGRDHDYKLYGYMDSYWAETSIDMNITSCGCYFLGSSMISWFSKKHSSVSLSTIESEYIVACFACCEAIWLQKLMLGSFDMELDTTIILCDNQSYINMEGNVMSPFL